MKKTACLALLGLALTLSSCSTEPGETTQMGAVTGGAIGAGLGVLIGSQTGDPGTGLVLGGAAGAGTGALIANSMEAQEKAIKTQEEALERQEQTIQAQRREINELRGGAGIDTSAHYDRSGSLSERINGSLSGSPRPTGADEQRIQEAYARAKPLRETTLGGANAVYDDLGRSAPNGTSSGVSERTFGAAMPAYENDSYDADTGARGALAIDRAPSAIENLNGSAVQGEESRVAVSGECREAEQEVRKGNAAPESADKLFHLRRALRLCPTNPDYHTQLGQLYLSLNRPNDAEYEFKEALSLDPSFSPAEQSLARLRR